MYGSSIFRRPQRVDAKVVARPARAFMRLAVRPTSRSPRISEERKSHAGGDYLLELRARQHRGLWRDEWHRDCRGHLKPARHPQRRQRIALLHASPAPTHRDHGRSDSPRRHDRLRHLILSPVLAGRALSLGNHRGSPNMRAVGESRPQRTDQLPAKAALKSHAKSAKLRGALPIRFWKSLLETSPQLSLKAVR